MFSGIVQTLGTVIAVTSSDGNQRLQIQSEQDFANALSMGASVAVSGVCLTVVEHTADCFAVDVSDATMACTTLANLDIGRTVNLEPALRLQDTVDGHLVSGHIDGTGTIQTMESCGESTALTVGADASLLRYIVKKGSVCIDGVSLTVNQVKDNSFTINLIPHTIQATTFVSNKEGDLVNIEVDLIARYIEKLIQAG